MSTTKAPAAPSGRICEKSLSQLIMKQTIFNSISQTLTHVYTLYLGEDIGDCHFICQGSCFPMWY